MAFCSNCGKELVEDAKFCFGCGSAVNEVSANEQEQRKTFYDGDLHKCPKCGEHLNAFVTICPVCDYELRGAQTASSVHELAQKIEKTESYEQKEELISNFYIPNTKEDIYEFFILAYSYISAGSDDADIWSVKLEQAYLKARLAFGKGEEYDYIKELYEKISNPAEKKKKLKTKDSKAAFLFGLGLSIAFVGFLLAILSDSCPFSIDSLYTGFIIAIGAFFFVVGLIMWIIPSGKRKAKRNR